MNKKTLLTATLRISQLEKKTGIRKYTFDSLIKRGELKVYQRDKGYIRYLSWQWLIDALPFIMERHSRTDDLKQRAEKAVGQVEDKDEERFWQAVLEQV